MFGVFSCSARSLMTLLSKYLENISITSPFIYHIGQSIYKSQFNPKQQNIFSQSTPLSQYIMNVTVIPNKLFYNTTNNSNQPLMYIPRKHENMLPIKHENMLATKHENMLTTKITSNSFDFNTYFGSVLQKILSIKIKIIKRQAFIKIKDKHAKSMKVCNSDPQIMMFLHHCAGIIQSRWKGYRERKYFRMFRPVMWRFKELVMAVVVGWKVRKIMKLKSVHKKCNKIKEMLAKNNYRDARILKRDLIDDIERLSQKGKWIQQNQQNKYNNIQSKTHNKKIILRTALKCSASIQNKQQQLVKKKKSNKNQQIKQFTIQEEPKKNTVVMNQTQIPIKSTGFYNIPQNQPVQNIDKNKVQKQKTNKQKKLSLQKKNLQKKNTEQKIVNQQKIDKKAKNDGSQKIQKESIENNNQKKKDYQIETDKKQKKQNLSTFSIHLPVQQAQIEEMNPAMSRKMLQVKKIGSSNIDINIENPLAETHKLKRSGKGIRVTLSSSTKQQPEKQLPQAKTGHTSIVVKMTPQTMQPDQLSQLFSVYNSTYSKKKQETLSRYREMKQNNKFLY